MTMGWTTDDVRRRPSRIWQLMGHAARNVDVSKDCKLCMCKTVTHALSVISYLSVEEY